MTDFAVIRVDEPVKDDYTWLASKHALNTAFPGTILLSAFTKATHFPNGYVRSGTPVVKNGDTYEAVVDAAGVVEFDAIILEPVAVRDGQTVAPVALIDHGIVHGSRLRGVPAGTLTKSPAASGITVR